MPALSQLRSPGNSPPTDAGSTCRTVYPRARDSHYERSYAVGDEVQVRSGGATMIVRGYAVNGEVVCDLRGRMFELPELLLKVIGGRPVRRGRKPGISP